MFSVVIPLYNKELSIRNTIQSLLEQAFPEFEIVVVNDGSTDRSVEIVKQIEDSRIRIIEKANGGVSCARNRGIEEAKYEWIAFLDGDDLWKKNHLEEILKMMKQFPGEKVYATSFEYSDRRTFFRHPRESEIFEIKNYFKEALKETLMWTSIVVINKECFDNIGGFNRLLVRGEDKDVWARVAKDYNIIKSDVITAIYRIEAENRSDKTVNVKRTYEATIDFKKVTNRDEDKYYRKMIIDKMKSCFMRKEWGAVFYLLFKYNFRLLM